MSARTRWLRVLAIAASFLAIARLTLLPQPAYVITSSRWCLVCGELGGVDFVLNILLFVPFGMALGWGARSVWKPAVIAAVTSLAIEILQMRIVSGRDASAGDLLTNTIGGALGGLLAIHLRDVVIPAPRLALRLALCWSGLAVAVITVSEWLLAPAFPFLDHYVQWQPHKSGYDDFDGTLESLTINGVPLHEGQKVDPLDKPAAYVIDSTVVAATVRAGGPTRHIAIIGRLVNPISEVFMIGRRGDDLVFRVGLRASRARFRLPVAVLPAAFAVEASSGADELVRVRARLADGEMHLERWRGGVVERSVTRLTPGLAWAFVLPRDLALGALARVANVLWTLTLSLPAFYWCVLAWGDSRTRIVAAGAGAAILFALVVAPVFAALPPAGTEEWSGVLLGAVSGIGAARLASRRQHRDSTPRAEFG